MLLRMLVQLHKILQGLFDVYTYTSSRIALEIAIRCVDGFVLPFVNEIYKRGGEERMQYVLEIEFGGMQDILYQIYGVTRKEEHKWYAI